MRLLFGCAVSFALIGCADMKVAYEKELTDEQAPSTATVVIARFFVGHVYSPIAFVNGEPRCELQDKTYCIVQLPPGTHRFAMDLAENQVRGPRRFAPPPRLTVPLEVVAGTTNFVRLDSSVNQVIPIVLPGYVGIYGKVRTFIAPMSKEDFLKMRPQIDRVKALEAK